MKINRELFAHLPNSHYLCNDYEKNRNEKSRNMENPFKFGTIVEARHILWSEYGT